MAETRRSLTAEDLLALEVAGDPQLSPDGQRLIYVVKSINKEKNEYNTRLVSVRLDGDRTPRPFTAGPHDQAPRWSPDGNWVAFTRKVGDESQLFVISAHGGEARQVTSVKGGVSAPVWAPDSDRIAVTVTVGPEGLVKPAPDEEKDLFKKYTKGVRRYNTAVYKFDGTGLLDLTKWRQICVVSLPDAASEPVLPRQVTQGSHNHGDAAWSPDGKQIAFIANRREDWDYTPMFRDLWVIDAAGGEPRQLTHELSLHNPVWSPDGRRIAVLGYDHFKERYHCTNTHLLLVDSQSGQVERLDKEWDRPWGPEATSDVPGFGDASPVWAPDGSALLLLGSDRGCQNLYRIDTATGAVTSLTTGAHCIYSFSFDAACKTVAVAQTTPLVPGDIYLADCRPGTPVTRLTDVNADLLAQVELAPVEEFQQEPHAWIMKPLRFEEGKQYPAVLEVHGGPMAMYGWTFFMEFQLLAAAGYAVIYGNPRGSQGYGQEYCACIANDWGNKDYEDVMATLDGALQRFPWIDGNRVGIAGGSYGGFMVNHTLGQTDRFKAGITMRSCVNEATMVGTSDVGLVDMLYHYPAKPWDEDLSFYRRMSPLTNVEKINAPLLIEHQENDLRCPIEQAEQLYNALKALRRTVEFIRYPDSSHGMSRTGKPWLRVYRLQTITDWFDRYLTAH